MKAFKELLILTSFFGVIMIVLILRDDFYEDPSHRFVAKLPVVEEELKIYDTFRSEFFQNTISTPFLHGLLNAYGGKDEEVCRSFGIGISRCLEGFYFYVYFRILSKLKKKNKVVFINHLNELILGLKDSPLESATALGMLVRHFNFYLDHDMIYPLDREDYKHQYFVEGWAFYNIAVLDKWQDLTFICKKYMPKGFIFYCLWGMGRGISYFGEEKLYGKEIKKLPSYSFFNGVYGIPQAPNKFAYIQGKLLSSFFLGKEGEKRNKELIRCLNKEHVSTCLGFKGSL